MSLKIPRSIRPASIDRYGQDLTTRSGAFPLKKTHPQIFMDPDPVKAFSYKTLLDATYDWEVFYDLNGKPLYTSQGIRHLLGYRPRDYVSGKIHLEDLVLKDDRDRMKKYLTVVQSGRSFNDKELRFVRKDKKMVYVSISAQPVRDGFRQRLGFRLSVRDVTRRRTAEQKYEFLSAITAQVSDSIIVTDRKFKIIYVNKATERLYGYTKSEMLGRTPGFRAVYE